MKEKLLRPVNPALLYPKSVLMEMTGLGTKCLNQAQREGALRVKYVGGRVFVLGRDFVEWVELQGKSRKDDPRQQKFPFMTEEE